jgi:hypothetical protein
MRGPRFVPTTYTPQSVGHKCCSSSGGILIAVSLLGHSTLFTQPLGLNNLSYFCERSISAECGHASPAPDPHAPYHLM